FHLLCDPESCVRIFREPARQCLIEDRCGNGSVARANNPAGIQIHVNSLCRMANPRSEKKRLKPIGETRIGLQARKYLCVSQTTDRKEVTLKFAVVRYLGHYYPFVLYFNSNAQSRIFWYDWLLRIPRPVGARKPAEPAFPSL